MYTNKNAFFVLSCLGILLAGCGAQVKQVSETPVPEAEALEVEQVSHPATGDVPDVYKVKLDTTQGEVIVEVHRDWSPNGADRFHKLVNSGFYDGCRFFRVLDGFMAQVGINGDPDVQKKWRDNNIKDDEVKQSNKKGYVTYAKSGAPNSRSTQIFFNYKDNSFLDNQGFSPFGKVIKGMDVLEKLYKEYGEGAPQGNGPSQQRIQFEGNKYLNENFPKLDYIKRATIVKDKKDAEQEASAQTDAAAN